MAALRTRTTGDIWMVFSILAIGLAGIAAPSRDWPGVVHQVRANSDSGRARNVILLIGDGMGDSEITIARNYETGANGRLWMDRLPQTGAYTTYALQESHPE